MKKMIAFLVLCLSSLALLSVTSIASAASASSAQDVFDEVNYYLVLNYGGFSKSDVKTFSDKYQPQITRACMDRVNSCPPEAAYPVVDNMLLELADKHTQFVPGESARVKAIFAGTATNKGFGINLTQLENRSGAFVEAVSEGSSGQEAGVKRGDWLLGINGLTLGSDLEKISELWLAAQNNLETSSLVISRQNKTLVVRLKPKELNALELPTLSLRDDGVGILKIPSFALKPRVIGLAIHERVLEAQRRGTKALVVDLRGNGGGVLLDEMAGVSAFIPDGLKRNLVSRNAFAGFDAQYTSGEISQFQNGITRLVYSVAKPAKWTLPVAVLVNAGSASASEFFSLDVQNAKRGAVVGEVTAGVANTAISGFGLSDGSYLFVTIAKSLRPDGTAFPEFVTPDLAVKDDLDQLNRTGRDAVLEAALGTLKD
jgi:carboxyl-terminal processing protease